MVAASLLKCEHCTVAAEVRSHCLGEQAFSDIGEYEAALAVGPLVALTALDLSLNNGFAHTSGYATADGGSEPVRYGIHVQGFPTGACG
jgi:hypothetical protein